jgi:predicted alpha/beta hydrolase family esterase
MFSKHAPFDINWQTLARRAADFHSPLNLQPRISSDNILVVASRGDKLCPFELVEKLKQQWGLSHCYYRTGGHWLVFDRQRGHAWYKFLKDKGFIAE